MKKNNQHTQHMKLNYILLTLAAFLGCAATGHSETPDSVTVTVSWTLTNTTSNKDAVNSFAIYNNQGFYQYFNATDLDKFKSTRKMPVRVPKQGLYTMIMNYTNKRPAASTMKKYIIREKVTLEGDSVMAFKGSECTRHLGFSYVLPDGRPLKFMYKASGKPDDWSEATSTNTTFQTTLVAKDQPKYNWTTMTPVQYGNSTLGNDRGKSTDIYFNPGISDNFEYITTATIHLLDTTDTVKHAADPNQPMLYISMTAPLSTTQKETLLRNSGVFRTIVPDTIAKSLYPAQDAATRWGYRALALDTEKETARGTIVSGALFNTNGALAYDLSEKSDPLVIMLHQYETKKVRSLCVESGAGIAHMPLYLTRNNEPEMIMEGNVGQGMVYNTLSDQRLFLVKKHPFYSYKLSEQKPEYGNSAPFFAFTYIAAPLTSAYSYSYPANTSNGEWVGNAGERRCVDLFSKGVAVVAGNDTIATEWGKVYSSIQTFEKTDHDPVDIKIILDNTNFTVDTLQGHSRAEFTYHENEADVVPPTLTMLQLRNKSGKITNKFEKLADVDIFFNAADFYRNSPEMYLLNSPYTVKAEIASRGSKNFTELQIQDYKANSAAFTWGDGYKIDLSQYEHKNRDGWFQLRFTLTDAKGNKCVQTISPALFAKGSANGVNSVGDDAPFGISMEGTTLRVQALSSADVQLFNLSGSMVCSATGNEFDLSALPAGVYVVRAAADGAVATRKILVR